MPDIDRNPWSVRDSDFPAKGALEARLTFLLRYAILAPSARNSQPWRFRIVGRRISLHADLSRWQRVADPNQRELRVSLGCALENLLIAAEHFGFGHQVSYFGRDQIHSLAATVELDGRPQPAPFRPASLFAAITRRRTNHARYLSRAVSPTVLGKLRACESDLKITLLLTQDAPIRQAVDKLMLQADALLLADPKFRNELGDAIGGGNFGGPWVLSLLQQFAVTHLRVEGLLAKRDHAALTSAPVFGLISGRVAGPEFELKAGQLLERLYLAATGLGLCIQPVSQLLEAQKVKTKFTRLFGAGGVPLLPFRLGYGDPPPRPTPRRALDDVLG
jgi:nitroreductase